MRSVDDPLASRPPRLPILGVTLVLPLCGALACAPARPPRAALDGEFSSLLPRDAATARLTADTWRGARRRLGVLREQAKGAGARTLRIRLALREPHAGRMLEARGAVAIAPSLDAGSSTEPPGALRMILLGPGGTTALDLWARGHQFRFEIPALGLLRRGDATTSRAALRGLPVSFLRWWLLRPASGELLWYERVGATDRYVLRDGDAIIELAAREGGPIAARRSTWHDGLERRLLDEEVVIAERVGCGTVRYAQASTGLLVTVRCEGEEQGRSPDPRAFADPDAKGGAS